MKLEEALEYLQHVKGKGIGLSAFSEFLDRIGNPQKKLRFIHVTGTNGKGSTCAFISTVLNRAGYQTGLYTSPYIHRYQERIRVNGQEIPEEALCRLTEIVYKANQDSVSEGLPPLNAFENCTALGFLFFAEMKCDLVVLEVGVGGRLDTTNCFGANESVLSIITSIGLDHEAFLGSTVEKIALEKAGIMKPGRPVIVLQQDQKVLSVLREASDSRNSSLIIAEPSKITNVKMDLTGNTFDYREFSNIKISLLGKYQISNAIIALEAFRLLRSLGYSISNDAIYSGMEKTKWIGRMELLHDDPVVIVDGAHNIQGLNVFFQSYSLLFPGRLCKVIFGVLADKNILKASPLLSDYAETVYTVTPPSERAMKNEQLSEKLLAMGIHKTKPCESIREAIELALLEQDRNQVICILGSLYQVAQAREYFGKKSFED